MTDQTPLWTIIVYMSGDSVLDNFAIESLRQLRDAAGDGVTVHYLFDPNDGVSSPKSDSYNGQNKNTNASVFAAGANKNAYLAKIMRGKNTSIDTADPATLRGFIDSVIHRPYSPTGTDDTNHRYGLILWGHGPELLLDAKQPRKSKPGARLDGKYLTPARLRAALTPELPAKKKLKDGSKSGEKEAGASSRKLDFIALDACSMSMVEVAAELQEYVEFMIASQDDVPDQSFPYQQILSLLKKKSNAREVCREIPQEYKDAFQDYFPAPGPAITNITLASLNLQNVEKVTVPLGKLAAALHTSALASKKARKAIIRARSASRDFVLGLYVDIYDFCQNLGKEKNLGTDLKSICKEIRDALTVDSQNGDLILNNQTIEQGEVRCHGLSVYLPYLTSAESKDIEKSLTLGGRGIATQLSKGGSTANLHKGGSTANLHKSRAARIAETEKDLASLKCFNEKTGWKKFIKETWSYILVKEEPRRLDLHYSGEQCALNLLPLSKAGRLHVITGGAKYKRPSKSGISVKRVS